MTEPQTGRDPGVATPGPSPARTVGWLLILLSLAIAILPYAVPAAAPFAMGSWTAWGSPTVYDGGLQGTDGTRREACECRLQDTNAIR